MSGFPLAFLILFFVFEIIFFLFYFPFSFLRPKLGIWWIERDWAWLRDVYANLKVGFWCRSDVGLIFQVWKRLRGHEMATWSKITKHHDYAKLQSRLSEHLCSLRWELFKRLACVYTIAWERIILDLNEKSCLSKDKVLLLWWHTKENSKSLS